MSVCGTLGWMAVTRKKCSAAALRFIGEKSADVAADDDEQRQNNFRLPDVAFGRVPENHQRGRIQRERKPDDEKRNAINAGDRRDLDERDELVLRDAEEAPRKAAENPRAHHFQRHPRRRAARAPTAYGRTRFRLANSEIRNLKPARPTRPENSARTRPAPASRESESRWRASAAASKATPARRPIR